MALEGIYSALLVFDELQKISNWSAAIKKHWDRDTREKRDIKLVISGSSRLLLMDGLSESLAGRFELNYAGHWSYAEMRGAFNFSAEEYQWFGGYPGAAGFIKDEPRFKEYIRNAIIEPTMTRDVLLTAKMDKPALLRQLFEIGAGYGSQIVSYNKMLGQLQDAGNTTTLARYLTLLDQAGLLAGLNKYGGSHAGIKKSIPKLQIHNTALMSAMRGDVFENIYKNRAEWGNIVECSVGEYLINQVNKTANAALYYWRENGGEIDFVVTYGNKMLGIEVKSGDSGLPNKTAASFAARFPDAKLILVGRHGIPYETFVNAELGELFAAV